MSAKVEYAFRDYLKGKLSYHRMNFELLLDNPRPIPEHTDFMEALEKEQEKILIQYELQEMMKSHDSIKMEYGTLADSLLT